MCARNGLEPTISIVETACWSTEGEAAIASRGDPGGARLSFTQAVQPRVALTTLDRYAAKTGLSSVDMIFRPYRRRGLRSLEARSWDSAAIPPDSNCRDRSPGAVWRLRGEVAGLHG